MTLSSSAVISSAIWSIGLPVLMCLVVPIPPSVVLAYAFGALANALSILIGSRLCNPPRKERRGRI